MKKYSKVGIIFLAVLGLSVAYNTAKSAEHKLSEFNLGEHLSGPEVKLDQLEGKVVVIEYWGTR